MVHPLKSSSPLKRPSVQWTAAVAVLMLVFLALNSVPQLRPLWKLLVAGLSANQPTVDLGSLLVGIDSFRAAGYRMDLSAMQKALIANSLPPFNFPYIWLWLAYVPGIGFKNVLFVAAVMYAALGTTFILLFRGEERRVQFIVLLALLSPSVGLLFERGNIDIVMFCLVAWAALLLAKNTLRFELSASALLLLAAFLKLFPIAAALSFLRTASLRGRILLSICALLFVLGAAAQRGDIQRVLEVTPDPPHNAYGAKVLVYELLGKVKFQRDAKQLHFIWEQLQSRKDYARLVSTGGLLFQIAATLAGGACFLLGLRALSAVAGATLLRANQKSTFLAGASIYIATFIVRNNWCYRLVFLTLCISAIAGLVRAARPKHAAFFRALLCIIVGLLWITPIYEPMEYFLIHNILHWFAVGGLAFTCGVIIRSTFAERSEEAASGIGQRALC